MVIDTMGILIDTRHAYQDTAYTFRSPHVFTCIFIYTNVHVRVRVRVRVREKAEGERTHARARERAQETERKRERESAREIAILNTIANIRERGRARTCTS